jgi:hypothetical protein
MTKVPKKAKLVKQGVPNSPKKTKAKANPAKIKKNKPSK